MQEEMVSKNASRVGQKQKLRRLILLLTLLLVCIGVGVSGIRWAKHSLLSCFVDAQPGDTIYPIYPMGKSQAASEIPLGVIHLPQSMRHFGCEWFFMMQGGSTDIWFEMDADEFDQFLTTNAVEYPSSPPERIPNFGPIRWKRPKSAYRFIEYDTEYLSTFTTSYLWIDEVRGSTSRVYISLWYGD